MILSFTIPEKLPKNYIVNDIGSNIMNDVVDHKKGHNTVSDKTAGFSDKLDGLLVDYVSTMERYLTSTHRKKCGTHAHTIK